MTARLSQSPLWFAVLVAALACSGSARAADLNVALPTLTVPPGGTVDVVMNVAPSPDPFPGIRAIEYRLKLGSSVVQSAQVLNEGFLWTWGAPFMNVGPDSVLVATAGATDTPDGVTHMSTVRVMIKASAVIGTDLPLTFSRLLFNEGVPSVSSTAGVLQIRAGSTGVGDRDPGRLALATPRPNPARDRTRISFRVPEDAIGDARLELFAIDGRRIRGERVATAEGDVSWSLVEAGTRRIAAGLYFVRLTAGREMRIARLVVMP